MLRGSCAHRTRLVWPALALLSVWLAPRAVRASSADDETSEEHFEKGVAATDAGRLAEAADEFRRAYRQSEAFLILYNIGQVEALRGRPVEAVEAFERYLAEGGAEIPARRRQSVRGEIEAQSARIGTIDVRTAPLGAEVLVDGVSVGHTPFARPVRVLAGRHQVEAKLPGHVVEARALEVVGRSDVALQLALAPLTAVELERHFVDPAVVAAQTTRPLELESTGAVRPARIAGYLLVVAGVATATAGALVAYSGARLANEANTELASAPTPAAWDRAKVDFDDGKARNTKGWVIAGVGGALLIGGAFVLVTTPQRALALGAWTTADAGGVRLGGVW